jgi:uncharacterized membrane protein YdfJ with MMPL/SSD domain
MSTKSERRPALANAARPAGPTGSSLLIRLAALVLARPRAVIAVWGLVALAGAVVAVGPITQLPNRGFFVPGSPSDTAQRLLDERFPGGGTPLLAVVERRDAGPRWGAPEAAALVERALTDNEARKFATAGAAVPKGRPADLVVLVAFRLRTEAAAAERAVPRLRAALEQVSDARTTLGLFGGPVVTESYSAIAREDLRRTELIAFPFTLAVLVVAFVSVAAALLPLLLAVVVLVVSFLCLFALGHQAGLSVFVTNTASVLALALSIDFALFMITRFREELAAGRGVDDALVHTMATTGRAIALSGLTVAISLLALAAVGIHLFTSMALGATFATLVAMIAALTLLPAIMRLLGPRVDWLRIDSVARAARRATLWRRLGEIVTHRPVPCALAVTVAMLAMAAPATSLDLDLRIESSLPAAADARQQAERIGRAFHPGGPAPVDVVTTLNEWPRALWRDPAVAQTTGEASGTRGWEALKAILAYDSDSPQARAAVMRLRRLFDAAPGETYVGGPTAASIDLLDRIEERTPWVVALTVLVGAVVLCIGLRSIVIPIKAVLTTLLTVAATIGILLRLLPSETGGGSLEFFVPLFLFAIVFGLSVDYEVFLLSRIREAVLNGRSNAEAVRVGLLRSARPITLAGIALATVFAGLATSQLLAFRQLGVGVAIAIVLDVTLVRCVLVPATVVILGRWNWWFFGTSGRPLRARRSAA